MNRFQDLTSALLDLLHELQGTDIKLIIGGGFGIYLQAINVPQGSQPTVLQERPEPRSTSDLDLFLKPELLITPGKLVPLSEAITRLHYDVVETAKNYQFVKPGPGGDKAGSIKIDLLTGPQSCFQGTPVKTDGHRAKPDPSVGIHAHLVNEAPTLEKGLLPIALAGNLSAGEACQAEVFLPHPYTFLMMKLFAFKDRYEDKTKDYGRHHALDLYSILATTIEKEWEYALQLRDENKQDPYVVEAGKLVAEYFSDLDALGMIRLRESKYYRHEFQAEQFMSVLKELFPAKS